MTRLCEGLQPSQIFLMSGKISPMFSKFAAFRSILLTIAAIWLPAVMGMGCAPVPVLSPASETAASSPLPAETTTSSRVPSATPTFLLTPTPRTPPALPDPYRSSFLYAGDSPHNYFTDTCQYLREKWTSTNAIPGTVVMVIMFHAVTNDPISTPNQISEYDFRHLMQSLRDNGFQPLLPHCPDRLRERSGN